MQALHCDVARARMKLGIAIAAKRPIMATTIMISTNVKAALRDVLFVFIFCFSFFNYGVNETTGGLQLLQFPFTDCLLKPQPTSL
jgi:uncharacterized membrane protein